MEEFINLVGNFGFPIALVIYFLARFEKKIDQLTHSLEILAQQINNILVRDQINKGYHNREDSYEKKNIQILMIKASFIFFL